MAAVNNNNNNAHINNSGLECCDQGHQAILGHHHGEDVVCIDHVSFNYDDSSTPPALDQVTLHVPEGIRLGIIGPNGGGKTTLIKLILGMLEPTAGKITVLGTTPTQACKKCLIGYVPQRMENELDFPLSVRQVVTLGLVGKTGLFKRITTTGHQTVNEAINMVGLSQNSDKPIGNLSGGQQQRAFIARAIALKPELLVLDEPMVGIDEAGQQQFAQLVTLLQQNYNLTIIIVSHNLRAISAGCDSVACLNRKLHFHDAPSGLTRKVLSEVFSHDIAYTSINNNNENQNQNHNNNHNHNNCCNNNSSSSNNNNCNDAQGVNPQ